MTAHTQDPATDRAARRFRLAGVLLPAGVASIVALAEFALLPLLPQVVAVHWGADGAADGYGPAWTYPVILLGIGVLLPVLLGLPVLRALERRSGMVHVRFLAAVNGFLAGLGSGLSLSAMVAQTGADPQAPGVGVVLGPAVLAGLGLAMAAWLLTVDAPAVPADAQRQPAPMRLADGERAVWLRSVRLPRAGRIALFALLVLVLAGAVAMGAGDLRTTGRLSSGTWILGGTAIAVTLPALALTDFRLRIDGRGLDLRSVLGWPRVRIAVEHVEEAQVVDVNAIGEYGGYGWRIAPGSGTGVVTRTGEALRVTRRDGRMLTVTVDDAPTAVALLRALQAEEGK